MMDHIIPCLLVTEYLNYFLLIHPILYGVFIFALLYWIFLNSTRYITFTDIKRLTLFSLFIPFVILGGLIAQVLRPLLRGGMDTGAIWDKLLLNLNVFNPDNPLLSVMYFGLTELMHRLSSLQAQFFILNDRYINPPGDTFNLLHTFQRTINDFQRVLMIFDGKFTISTRNYRFSQKN